VQLYTLIGWSQQR